MYKINRLKILIVLVLILGFSMVSGSVELKFKYWRFDPVKEFPEVSNEWKYSEFGKGEDIYIVQFDKPIGLKEIGLLEERVETIYDYIPDFAYLVRAKKTELDRLIKEGVIRVYLLYQPLFKVDFSAFEKDEDIKWIKVKIFNDFDLNLVESELEKLGAVVEKEFFEGEHIILRVKYRRELIGTLARIKFVKWIEPERYIYLFNDQTTWCLQSNEQGNHSIWDKGIKGEGQIVGILDSGLDYGSCFFRDDRNNVPGPNHRKVIAYRAYGGNMYDSCLLGHGTHVSGTCAGDDIYGNMSNYNGMAPKARITFGDIQGNSFVECYMGQLTLDTELDVIFGDSYNDGARVHTNSWGTMQNSYDTLSVAVDSFMWRHPDFLIFFANGNSGPAQATVSSPATAKDCVSVGATNRPPGQSSVAFFSSRGPTNDGRLKPTLCTPGVDVNSAKNTAGDQIVPSCNIIGLFMSGTSMATPSAAGSALLVRQYFVEGFYPTGQKNPNNSIIPSASLIKAMLIASADKMDGERPSNDQGWGRILLDDALYFQGDSNKLWISDEKVGLATGENKTYNIEVISSKHPLKIVLVWTDHPGAENTGLALVNDLDLTVTKSGTIYIGNNFLNGWSREGISDYDRLNPVECVFIENPEAGNYEIKVSAYNVPMGAFGKQHYSLVVTGDIRTSGMPTPTPTPIPTGTMIPTPTPTSSYVPTPTPTKTPSNYTPTPTIPIGPQVYLSLNKKYFSELDRFILKVRTINPGLAIYVDHYIILDLGEAFGENRFYFWPSWTTEPDFVRRLLSDYYNKESTILDFYIPENITPFGPLYFYTALLQPGTYNIISNIDSVEFYFRP